MRVWRQGSGGKWLKLGFEPLSDAPFHAQFDPILDGERIVRASFSPGMTVRSDELAKDGDDDFGLLIAETRRLHAYQRGRDLQLRRAEATLLRISDPGVVGGAEDFGFTTILVPFEK